MTTPELFQKLGQASNTVEYLEEKGLKEIASSYDALINSIDNEDLLDPVVDLGVRIKGFIEDVEGELQDERS